MRIVGGSQRLGELAELGKPFLGICGARLRLFPLAVRKPMIVLAMIAQSGPGVRMIGIELDRGLEMGALLIRQSLLSAPIGQFELTGGGLWILVANL